MAKIELALDFGSAYITIFKKDGGLMLREPTIAAVMRNKNKLEIMESGFRAKSLLSRSLGGAQIVYPVKEGAVTDVDACAALLKEYISRVIPQSLIKPSVSVMVLISSALTNPERKDIEKAFVKAGIKDITLVESPLALIAYTDSVGGLFLDVGAGKTEIASVTKRGIASGYTINIAGGAFNNAIIEMVADRYRLKIGDWTAERIKISSASFFDNDKSEVEVGGRDIVDGSPKSVNIIASDIRNAVRPLAEYVVEAVEAVLSTTPPELVAEISRKGIFLSGGSSAIPGFAEFISARLDMPVTVLADRENAVALGGGRLISDTHLLGELLGLKLV